MEDQRVDDKMYIYYKGRDLDRSHDKGSRGNILRCYEEKRYRFKQTDPSNYEYLSCVECGFIISAYEPSVYSIYKHTIEL